MTVGASTDSESVNGNAYPNYTCQDAPYSWVDVTGVPPLFAADGDDTFSTLNITFPFPFFGQTPSHRVRLLERLPGSGLQCWSDGLRECGHPDEREFRTA